MQLIYLILLFTLCSGCDSASGVLGRTKPLLSDNFENQDWKYDRKTHTSSNGFWKGSPGEKGSDPSDRGAPTILERVSPPRKGRKRGSNGALKIGTDRPHDDNDSKQDDLRANFEQTPKRAEQPVFIARVWLPPFDKWGEQYSFGFRLEAQSNGIPDSYYPSIWLRYNHVIQRRNGSYAFFPGPHFFLRIFYHDVNMRYYEEYGGSIKQPGWWTLAIAFDKKGACSYYARPGVETLTEENKISDDTQFMTKHGIKVLLMDHVNAGLFSLAYPEHGSISPHFEIDDYEVWVDK